MKRIIIVFLGLCLTIAVKAQVPQYGSRLVALIDCNYRIDNADTFIRYAISVEKDIVALESRLGPWPIEARILVLDYKTSQVINRFEHPLSYDFGIVSHKNSLELLIYVASVSQANKKTPQDGMLYFKMPIRGGMAAPINREYFLANRDLYDLSMSNYEVAVAHWPEGVSQAWPRSTNLFFRQSYNYGDYTTYRDELVIFNEYLVGALDDSRAPYAAYTVHGDFLFRFPYTISPLHTMGNYVQMVPGTNQVMLYSHGIVGDIYPELKGTELSKQRRDFVFVYELYRADEWPEPMDSSAQLIRIKPDFTGIEKAERFDASRFNVAPGELPVYGLRGILTEDRVNLRSAPGLQGRVLLLMDLKEHFFSNTHGGFIILERSQHQDTIGGKTDYWYRIFWRPPEFNATGTRDPEGWVFGSFVKIFDPKIPYREQLGK